MVHTRSGAASPAVSRVRGTTPSPLRPKPAAADSAPPAPVEQPRSASAHLRRAGFLALLCYLGWFVLILGGILAYEGGCLHVLFGRCCRDSRSVAGATTHAPAPPALPASPALAPAMATPTIT